MSDLDLPSISLHHLASFVAISEEATWAAAADRLGVTPSALSQGMAEFERRLGLALFERRGRRREIAPSAMPVLDYARSIVTQTSDLTRWVEATRTGREGRIRIGMIDVAAIHHHAAALRTFRSEIGAEIHLTVAPSQILLDDLTAGRLDIAVVVRPIEEPPPLEFTPLFEEPLAIYRPDDDRPTPRDPARWGPWVLFPSTSHTRRRIEQALRELGAPVEVTTESNQPEVLAEMVRLGLGWTVLPEVQAEVGDRPLRRARAAPLTTRTLVAARRRGAVPSAVVERLLDQLDGGDQPTS